MEVIRYKYTFALVTIILKLVANETTNTTTNCPFTRIIEDIFKIHNKTSNAGIYLKNNEKAKIFLNTVANITSSDIDSNNTAQDELVNDIIASINRIKNNITADKSNDTKLNEAIIINMPKENFKNESIKTDFLVDGNKKHVFQIKSGVEEKLDHTKRNEDKLTSDRHSEDSKEKTTYVEILTIEPNNTSINNTSSNNIMEVLKHLMPMFNSSLYKELHNVTIIERNHSQNHTFSATKNISTIVVTFCDKENFTKANVTFDSSETDIKPTNESAENPDYDYPFEGNPVPEEYDETLERNLTVGEKKDILEATKYGMRKMNELYSVVEPKLYSMGLWLDDSNPARYVAAFNAPSEDMDRFARYGYAALYATARLKQLSSTTEGLEGRTEASHAQFPAASALRQSPLLAHCPLKGAPKCPPASKRYRTHDGTCNNVNRPRWGSTMTPVQRFLPPSYSDGIQAPRRSVFGTPLPSAREISSFIHEDQHVESPGITHLLMQWGQFLDHDVTSSSQTRGFNGSVPRCCKDGGRDFVPKDLLHPECMPITVPPSDPFYGPRGVRCLDFIRSSPAPRDDCSLGWREQLNQVSAYIDGSPLYASSARQSDKLRLFRNGMLQYGRVQQRRPLLPPERKDELCRGGAVSTDCFKSGDARVNEHPGLVAAHIVWLRQHNRMAQELAHLNPHWSDEKIYQETRKIIGAMVQHITYREFLPVVLGTEVMKLFELEPHKKGYYQGYDPKINPSPASSFGSAAFRFGHSLVQPSMMRYDRFHKPMNNNVSLHEEVSNPSNIWSMGAVDRLLLGMVNQPIQKRDEFITEELTNHLFQTPKFDFGMDLAAINVQRGRDHGIAAYTAWREPCGLSAITDFEDLSRVMPARVVRKLQTLYRSVDDIDLFTGGMAERPVVGGLVGPTFACIIAQQFSNLRKGDRFWYENGGFESSFTPAQLQQIRRISFAQVLCHTLDHIDNIQPFAFLSPDHPDNERIPCRSGPLSDFDLSPWVEINSDLNNDISKSDDRPLSMKGPSTERPKRTKLTTTIRPTTKKNQKLSDAASNKVSQKRPINFTLTNKLTDQSKKTDDKGNTDNDSFTLNLDKIKGNLTIDDKLDFKNKTRRYNDDDSSSRYNYKKPTNHYDDYDDDEDNVQSVQSVVINNLSQKRPNNNFYNNRPVMTVTENIDKYTYLINYVPRPTESWRQSTRRNSNNDRDVVKVTYQTYDDTYRRHNKPYYYNRHDNDNNYYRRDRPTDTTKDFQSSARSNDDTVPTVKPSTTIDKIDNPGPTTDNLYKLVTFGYVGTYKGTHDVSSKSDEPDARYRLDTISKDFSTFSNADTDDKDKTNTMKLSTFFHYETVTKPYNAQRRNDEEPSTKNKYYYIKNVLHKYTEYDPTMTGQNNNKDLEQTNDKDLGQNTYKYPAETLEERAAVDKLAFLEDDEKSASPGKQKNKIGKPTKPAQTPSVAFQVMPSENSPSQWAVYDEVADLPEGFHRMPVINTDPQALREVPRPMPLHHLRLRLRRPGLF